ncbi:MAG: Asp-tRNA(Asn)/Glu-tRNA(Gln) amidotransferase subunit GatC, partial [Eubacterium sp.]|nr:Asp-tRNA(Asn)/Glu-tRNA(Gln) amidotransferase subunit GatC [Eubacterium sp.]
MININELEKLAMLRLSDKERASISAELNDIRAYMDILRELDTDGVEAKSHAFDLPCALREDECKKSLTSNEIIANAPDEQDGFFA